MSKVPIATRPVKGAIFGYGSIGPVHLLATRGTDDGTISPIPETEIAGVAEPVAERAENIPAAVPRYPDYQALLVRADVDVVHICLPHYLHAPATIAAAECGKSVICEKPMALTANEAERMLDAVRANGVGFSLISQNRLNFEKAWMKERILKGDMGTIRRLDWVVDWFRSPEYYAEGSGWRGRDAEARGGVIANQAYHTLDMVMWLADSAVAEVTASCTIDKTLHPAIDVPDRIEGDLVFRNGIRSHFLCTVCGDRKDVLTVEMLGERDGRETRVFADGGSIIDQNIVPSTPTSTADGATLGKACYGSSHQTNIALSYEAFMQGVPVPVPGETGIRVLSVIDAILQSEGKPVRFG
jgi:predicted dehydrogenase